MPDIPRIQIERQDARIGITSTPAKVQVIDKARPKMRIVSERPRMEIERKAPAFKVEPQRRPVARQGPARPHRYAAGAPDIPVRPARHSRLAEPAAAAAGTAPEAGGLTLNANSLELNKALHDYAAAPQAESLAQYMPSIEWEAGYININWSSAQMQIEWDQGDYMPSFAVEPHSVEIYLREKPYIKITVSDEVIAAMYGPQTDTKV
jgi:hypothetical protein